MPGVVKRDRIQPRRPPGPYSAGSEPSGIEWLTVETGDHEVARAALLVREQGHSQYGGNRHPPSPRTALRSDENSALGVPGTLDPQDAVRQVEVRPPERPTTYESLR